MSDGLSAELIYVYIYRKLLIIVPELLTLTESGKSEIKGKATLNFDIMDRSPGKLTIALSHYYKHSSGDMIPDPDMSIAIYTDRQIAEALAYQDADGFSVVYSIDGSWVDIAEKRKLNDFLSTWLDNLIEQGHSIRSVISRKKR